MKKICSICLLFCSFVFLIGQTTQTFTFNSSNIFLSPLPTPVGGIYPPTDFSQVNEPLISEAFADNPITLATANLEWPAAGNVPNVYFGGDFPDITGAGRRFSPLILNQTFDLNDFPIHMKGNFYNRNADALYNESYFWIGPANYQGFCGWVASPNEREGVLLGRYPYQFAINQGIVGTPPQNVLAEITHNLASNNEWYTLELVLDVVNTELVVSEVKVNNQAISSQNIIASVANLNFLNNFRLAMAIDDLGTAFEITTNYGSFTANITVSEDSICVGDCVNFTSLITDSLLCTGNTLYEWDFPGANTTSSVQQNPQNICYNSAGVYSIQLIATKGTCVDTSNLSITVSPSAICNPFIDTIGVFIDSISASVDSVCVGDCLNLNLYLSDSSLIDSNNIIYEWTFPGSTPSSVITANPSNICLTAAGTFQYTVIATNGLTSDSAQITIISSPLEICEVILDPCLFEIPNAFSPNDDGVNDDFGIVFTDGLCVVSNFKFVIYNRWGDNVFQSNNTSNKWDGTYKNKQAPIENYVWTLTMKANDQDFYLSGNVALLR